MGFLNVPSFIENFFNDSKIFLNYYKTYNKKFNLCHPKAKAGEGYLREFENVV